MRRPDIILLPIRQELADRLVRMFSFVGDTVFDPFLGTGTTSAAAAIGWEKLASASRLIAHYFDGAVSRLKQETCIAVPRT